MKQDSEDFLAALCQELARHPFLDSDQAIHHFLSETGKHLGCVSATWIGSALDKDVSAIPAMETIGGWFVVDYTTVMLEPSPLTQEELYALYFQLAQEHGVDPLTEHAVRGAGTLRGHTRLDYYDDATWAEHWHRKDYLSKMGTSEGMVIGVPVDAQAECYHTYQRGEGAEPFSRGEKAFAMRAGAAVAWLHRRLMALRGTLLPQERALSSQEKQVVKLLLGGASEKEIAVALDVAQPTAHTHVTSIYRKLNVSGKSGLVAQVMGT